MVGLTEVTSSGEELPTVTILPNFLPPNRAIEFLLRSQQLAGGGIGERSSSADPKRRSLRKKTTRGVILLRGLMYLFRLHKLSSITPEILEPPPIHEDTTHEITPCLKGALAEEMLPRIDGIEEVEEIRSNSSIPSADDRCGCKKPLLSADDVKIIASNVDLLIDS